jgi:hypothetical protein
MRFLAGALCIALLSTATGCSQVFDFERAKRMLRRSPPPTAPALFASALADLPAPHGLRATSGELRQVPLRWEPLLAGDIAGYVIERSDSREGPFDQLATLAGRLTTTHIDACAPPPPVPAGSGRGGRADLAAVSAVPEPVDGVTCFYRVRAFSATGHLGAVASEVVAATTAPPPAAPEDVRTYSHQPRMVPLSWRASEDPTVIGYRVERSPTSRGPFEEIARIAGRHRSTYADRGLGELRVFYYRVASVNADGGVGAGSEAVLAVTKPEPLPPLGLHVASRHLGANRIAWQPNVEHDVTAYRLLRIRADADAPELVTTVIAPATEAEDASVAAGEQLSYTVVAIDSDDLKSAPAEPLVVVGETYDLQASARADGIHLQWKARSDEGYHGARVVREGRLRDREFQVLGTGRWIDTDVKPGRRYRYRVILVRPDGSVAPRSAPVEIRVPDERTDSLIFRAGSVDSPA